VVGEGSGHLRGRWASKESDTSRRSAIWLAVIIRSIDVHVNQPRAFGIGYYDHRWSERVVAFIMSLQKVHNELRIGGSQPKTRHDRVTRQEG
jgi:hypothetical protein